MPAKKKNSNPGNRTRKSPKKENHKKDKAHNHNHKKSQKKSKKEDDENMKAQAFSLDTIIGVVIFLLVFTIFFSILSNNTEKDTTAELNEEAQTLLSKLTIEEENTDPDKDLSIVKKGEIREDKIKSLALKDYQELKDSLGIEGDFCIFFEDKDGKIINISNIVGDDEVLGIGNEKINISDLPCKMG